MEARGGEGRQDEWLLVQEAQGVQAAARGEGDKKKGCLQRGGIDKWASNVRLEILGVYILKWKLEGEARQVGEIKI